MGKDTMTLAMSGFLSSHSIKNTQYTYEVMEGWKYYRIKLSGVLFYIEEEWRNGFGMAVLQDVSARRQETQVCQM